MNTKTLRVALPTILTSAGLVLLCLTALPAPGSAQDAQPAAKRMQDRHGMRHWQLAMLRRGPQ